MRKIVMLFLLLNINLYGVSQDKGTSIYKVKCKQDASYKNVKGAPMEPLDIVSIDRSNNFQIVKYSFDLRPFFFDEYKNSRFSKDSFTNFSNKYLIDTVNLNKWKTKNDLYIEIRKLKDNVIQITPDLNWSGVFSDDKPFFINPNSFPNDDYINIKFNIDYWFFKKQIKSIDFIIKPDARGIPKKHNAAIFNTWGGARKIFKGMLYVGSDSFMVKIFTLQRSLLFSKYNSLFCISSANENYVEVLDPSFPAFSYQDSVYVGNKVVILDSISSNGDLVFFKEVGTNPAMKGLQAGGTIKSIEGEDFINNKYIEITLNNKQSNKYSLLHFWGSWCGPCIENIPKLKELHNKYNDNVLIISLPYESTIDTTKARALIRKFDINWTQIIQFRDAPFSKPAVIKDLRIDAFPTYILLNSKGEILVRTSDISAIEKIISIK
ncbi:MAG: TlpA family protein disulfide reductase [Chitinophagaceae bacterium]|nr:TlpA family protein disulfide reductase [Chitinophagaceae bacterium]